MRLIAEDRRTRAIDLLLTSPVRSSEIVLGKFLGAIGFATVLASSTLLYFGILALLGEPDPGMMLSNYVGFILLFGTLLATGLFASEGSCFIDGVGITRLTQNFARAQLDGAFRGDDREAIEVRTVIS